MWASNDARGTVPQHSPSEVSATTRVSDDPSDLSDTLGRMPGMLNDKVIAITGAGRGIGRAVALACAAEGAKIVVNDFGVGMDGAEPSSEVASAVVAEIEAAGGEAIALADDISTMAAGERLVG